MQTDDLCPKCGSSLGEVTETATGKKLQRCSQGNWNPTTKKNEGCDYVKWITPEPQTLEEKCPKCESLLVLQTTRFGKKMKKCSAGSWDKETKKAVGCDYVEWINGSTEPLEEKCPKCGESLVMFTTNAGKKMKKCSTSGWDKEKRQAIGCDFVEWQKQDYGKQSGGEEFLPPEE